MVKKSIIEREKKRRVLFKKYINKLNFYKKKIKNNKNISEISDIKLKIQKLPRNSSITRMRNRCFVTGRARGYFNRFGLSRHAIRILAFKGEIPGMIKIS